MDEAKVEPLIELLFDRSARVDERDGDTLPAELSAVRACRY